MKTKPMKHQTEGLKRLAAAPIYFALGAEQGTGKTWMLLADAERQFKDAKIDGLLVVAPKGVHTNWVKREIPTHLSVPHRAWAWTSVKTLKAQNAFSRLLRTEPDAMAIFTINVDALNTTRGKVAAAKFMQTFKTMMVVDESHQIKNPSASRTKNVIELGEMAVSRRIMSGTLVANSPIDVFSQYKFLKPGLLGTTSYRAFVAEYAELLPQDSAICSRVRGNPQIVKRDARGLPKYKNLEKLSEIMSPHTFRVTKEQCLDLPPKIYQTHYFELPHKQRQAYETLKETLMLERPDGGFDTFTALTILGKLRQVTSGFVLVDGEPVWMGCEERMNALKCCLDNIEGQAIIWAHFKVELRQIAEMLGEEAVQYHGEIDARSREEAIDAFQAGKARYFVASPAAGSTGLTLTAASTAIYFSNDYSLSQRRQSEDRCHRIGTKGNHVLYIDLVAEDTVDERIAAALQAKTEIAATILDGI